SCAAIVAAGGKVRAAGAPWRFLLRPRRWFRPAAPGSVPRPCRPAAPGRLAGQQPVPVPVRGGGLVQAPADSLTPRPPAHVVATAQEWLPCPRCVSLPQ